ncbi:hypothetical protein CkaCkLH20_08931 [Colletotrichum karsti]|uniref:Uncharacterized protein n=1 Tax=Colletotrichum karsti TaxID=1095194 RepID=A0A9P6I0D0_9PEZI|nr:uncharacterized protein CkaCkLH20_08931 [Colletotrichum karsti]KAF9873472.1 hypothetical protein CkaCkLH20_08931 [Colletotrichum karsti]
MCPHPAPSQCGEVQPPKTTKTCANVPALPFEVFLNVIDLLISEAEHLAEPIELCFYLSANAHPESRLDVQISDMYTNPRWTIKERRRRYQRLRLALQLCRTTRAIVHRKFRRVPIWDPFKKDTNHVLVYPRTDRFTPVLCRIPDDCARLEQALLRPTAADGVLVQCLVSIQGMPREFIYDEYAADVDTLLALPRLREITLNSEVVITSSNRYEFPDHPHPSADIVPINTYFFPTLGRWLQAHGKALEVFCRRAQERGIGVFVGSGGSAERKKLLLVATDDGVQAILLNPICTCDL